MSTTRRRLWAETVVVAAAAMAVMAMVVACTTTLSGTRPTHVVPTHFAAPLNCQANPSPAPSRGPDAGRISVTLTGIPGGLVVPGTSPTEVQVTLCNDSAVAYPAVGVVLVLDHCSCVPGGSPITRGTVERFDARTGQWRQEKHPAAGLGMDFLAGYSDVQDLPIGTEVSVRYRITLDPSMNAGDGGVTAAVVTPEPLAQIGGAYLAFRVPA